LGYVGISNITGQANSTWNLDVESSNNFRIFTQNATGTVSGIAMTGYSANNNILFGNSIAAPNVNFTAYKETVIAGGNTGASTLTPNVAAGTIFNYTLTGNITINALGNAVAGSSAVLILTQDATGNRLLSSTMKFAGNSKTLSTAASSIDIMSVFYDGTTYYATLSKGYA
jgi:hypothetical protein